MKRYLVLSSAVSALTVGAFPFAAFAAAADTAAPSVEELVVTAQRRAQDPQDVGIALTVIGGRSLAERGVTNVNDLQHQTPSLEITPAFGGGQPQFRLRGVGFEDYASNNTPTVGIYVDEVAYPVPAATQGVLFDLDRVEVLRGPQGTLYGRNTTGGAINFITRRPTDALSAGAFVEYGSFEQASVEAWLSGRLTSTLKGRLSAIGQGGGAWQHNRATGEDLGDVDRQAVRGQLQFDPTDKVDFLLNLHAGRDQSDGQGLRLIKAYSGVGPARGPDNDYRATGWGLRPDFAALIGTSPGQKPSRDNDTAGASLTGTFKFSGLTFTSISAYDKLKRRELNDWDGSQYNESDTFWHSDVEVYSQELRLASSGDGPLRWVVGVYGSGQKLDEKFFTDFRASPLVGIITNTHYRQEVSSAAVFGQAEYKVTSRTNLILGLRYEDEERKLRGFRTNANNAVDLFTNGDRDTSFKEVSGRLGVEHKLTDTTLLYATASRGVKSGGFTAYNSPNEHQIDAFDPEILYAYEGGFKADLSPSVRLNGAAFYYDYRDQQVLTTIINPVNGPIGRIANAPKSRIIGAELELVLKPIPGLTISQALAYKKGEYREFLDVDTAKVVRDPVTGLFSAGVVDRKGQDQGIPKVSFNGSVTYEWTAGAYALRAAADYAYRDRLTSVFLGPDFDIEPYWLANANFTVQPVNGRWSAGVWGRNIFDRKYDVTRNYFLPTSRLAASGHPASWGVRLGYSF